MRHADRAPAGRHQTDKGTRSASQLAFAGSAQLFASCKATASAEVERLTNVRDEIVRQIEQRRQPLIADRDLSREMLDVLKNAHGLEQRTRSQNGLTIPEPRYERYQINALVEASAETLRDPNLLKEVHQWEKNTARSDSEINWQGSAVAREIMSGLLSNKQRSNSTLSR